MFLKNTHVDFSLTTHMCSLPVDLDLKSNSVLAWQKLVHRLLPVDSYIHVDLNAQSDIYVCIITFEDHSIDSPWPLACRFSVVVVK